ncbi:hypothetical protein QEZ54_24620 [Catellatospora sp. KI3]|uniref:hypothetical protein n=1 Tax=Catellatospora sp. KI3 TaxID=3041620 RepID=UPI00248262AA|nr:hypothetical protein [Catellatospora sp. KI3]MDI1464167.1 hypothetical protein [Catellatospora sp. KI3]
MRARKLLAASIGTLLAAGFVTVIAPPAQAFWLDNVGANGRAYTDSKLPTQSFVNVAGDVPLGAWSDGAGVKHRSRAYYTFDVTRYAGKVISKTDVYVQEVSAADCGTAQPVEIWRTDAITSTTSWDDAPRQRELLGTANAGGPDATCPGYLVWDATAAMQRAAKRGDTTLTVEIRVPREFEGDLGHGRKLKRYAGLNVEWNTAPTNGSLAVEYPVGGCTTRQDPLVVPGRQVTLTQRLTDPDPNDYPRGEFAAWPVGHEDQRIEAAGTGYARDLSKVSWDMSRYPHGTVVAWTARAWDGHDYSAWAKPCFVKIDSKAPPAPKVTSAQYPADGQPHTGEGLPGTFTFSSRTTKDVVGYYWGRFGSAYNYVAAPTPGADATMQFTPTSFMERLTVQSVDKAGNRSPATEYEFYVRSSAPYVQVNAVGVNVPGSTLDIYHSDPETTEFGYSIGGGAETRVPVTAEGPTHVDVVFPVLGYVNVTVKAYAGTELIGAHSEDVMVRDLPRIESADFNWPDVEGQVDRPGTFTFRPARPDVVAYEWAFLYDDMQRIDAAPDGTATLTWTPTEPNWYVLNVRSISADGTVSEVNQFQFSVIDTKPAVRSDTYPDYWAGGGVGVPGEFEFDTAMPNASAYVYRFNGGPEQVVEIEWPYTSARVTLTPDHSGANTLSVKTRFADGTFSPVRDHVFQVSDAPVVTSSDYPEHNPAGRPGQEGEFTFHPGRTDTVAYRYSLGYGDETQTVAAGADGLATVRIAPQYSGYETLIVVGVAADGTLTAERRYQVVVRNPYPSVSSYYNSYSPRGGLGVKGWFDLYSELSEVTAYEYQVNGGAWQTVARDGYATRIELTMDRNGENVLSVRGRDAGGVITPQTDYPFLVGVQPRLSSTEYPIGEYRGGPGVAGQFHFLPGSPDVVEYEYQAGYADPVLVPAAADGTATVTWAPPSGGYYTWYLRAHLTDGTWSEYAYYSFGVNS